MHVKCHEIVEKEFVYGFIKHITLAPAIGLWHTIFRTCTM